MEGDPRPDQRVYYTSIATGDRGFMVKRYGADHIKLDRGDDTEETRLYRADEWNLAHVKRALNAHEVAQVAFEADRRLCRAQGKLKDARAEWLNLRETERLRWVAHGPKAPPGHLRLRMWAAIVKVLTDD